MEKDIKTFKDLTQEVVERGICGKCSRCISFCSAGEPNAPEMGKNEVPRYIYVDNCLKCARTHAYLSWGLGSPDGCTTT